MIKKKLLLLTILTLMPIMSGCAILTLPFKIVGTALDVTKATVKTAASVTTTAAKAVARPVNVALF